MRGVRQDSPLTTFGWPASRPRRVGWVLPPQEGTSGRRVRKYARSRRCPAGRSKTGHPFGEGDRVRRHGTVETSRRLRPDASPTGQRAGTTPAGPRIGLAVASVTVGHLPTGCSPGSTAPCRAALVDRPAISGVKVFGPKPRGSASPLDLFGGWGGGGADRVLEHGEGQEGSTPLGRKLQTRRPARSVKTQLNRKLDRGRSRRAAGKATRPAAGRRAPRTPLRWSTGCRTLKTNKAR